MHCNANLSVHNKHITYVTIHELSAPTKGEILELRPPWLPPDRVPHDLERSAKAISEGYNPNDPVVPRAMLLHHNKWGIPKSRLSESTPDFSRSFAERRDPNRPVLSVSSMTFRFVLSFVTVYFLGAGSGGRAPTCKGFDHPIDHAQ